MLDPMLKSRGLRTAFRSASYSPAKLKQAAANLVYESAIEDYRQDED